MNDPIEARLEALGLALPATEGESYYGAALRHHEALPHHRFGAASLGPCAGSQRRAPAPGTPRRDGVHRAGDGSGAVDRNERSGRHEAGAR